jgi:hypothetical protein
MGKFMKKKGYGARKRRDHMRDNVRLCFECKSPDHVVSDCPHKKDHDDKKRKDKKEKKEKKITFKKNKKGNGYVERYEEGLCKHCHLHQAISLRCFIDMPYGKVH